MKEKKKYLINLSLSVIILAVFLALLYLVVRTFIIIIAEYSWSDKIIAIALLLAEMFILVHVIGYMSELIRVIFFYKEFAEDHYAYEPLKKMPPVTIIIPSYKEELSVLKNTISACFNLRYKNKQIILLDDTKYDTEEGKSEKMQAYKKSIDDYCQEMEISLFRRQWRGAKAGIINDFIDYLEKKPKKGSFLKRFSKKRFTKPKYLVVFDADQNPFLDFLDPLVAKMEQNEKMAFIQTPQYYTNFEHNRVARASGLQQIVFYEFICEGKNLSNTMFCCGTNIIYRLNALVDVGGFDETSLTEDFATSFRFHTRNWQSSYYSRVGAFGMGPEDLGGYFKQQFRWACGTLGLFRKIVGLLFTNPKKLSPMQWIEYFLSGSFYFIGLVYIVLFICPILFLLFDLPSYFAKLQIYVVVFIPYITVMMLAFFWTLKKRGYKAKDLWFGQLLIAITATIYAKAAIYGLLNIKKPFEVTTKGASNQLPIKAIWPLLTLWSISFIAVIWGLLRIFYQREIVPAISINVFWCLYNFLILSSIFYFNKPEKKQEIET